MAEDEDWPWDDEDETIEINLRPPAEVAARLLAVVAVARRGFLEQRPEAVADDTAEAERFDLRSWLADEHLLDALYPDELEMIEAPVGSLEPDDTAAATWSIEAAAALAWTLDLISNIPAYDQPADAERLIAALPAPWSRTTEFRSSARLRSEESIAQERERAELWYDRADTYWWLLAATEEAETAAGGPNIAADLEQELRQTASAANAAGLISRPIGGDFPTSEGPYRDLLPHQVEELEAIAFHRSVALNWVCGLTDD
jgi:hypothetical protein